MKTILYYFYYTMIKLSRVSTQLIESHLAIIFLLF